MIGGADEMDGGSGGRETDGGGWREVTEIGGGREGWAERSEFSAASFHSHTHTLSLSHLSRVFSHLSHVSFHEKEKARERKREGGGEERESLCRGGGVTPVPAS
jgi:hypothetical protein